MKKIILFLSVFASSLLAQSTQITNADQYIFLKNNVSNTDTSKIIYNPAHINLDQYIFNKNILLNRITEKFNTSAINSDQYIFSKKVLTNPVSEKFDPSLINSDQYIFSNNPYLYIHIYKRDHESYQYMYQ